MLLVAAKFHEACSPYCAFPFPRSNKRDYDVSVLGLVQLALLFPLTPLALPQLLLFLLLSDLLSQQASLDLPAGLLEFASVEVARHLDPFIDGDATRFDAGRDGAYPPLFERMKAAATHPPSTLPSPPSPRLRGDGGWMEGVRVQ